MRYEKPVVVALADALNAIEFGGGKPSTVQLDIAHPEQASTNGAYEADE